MFKNTESNAELKSLDVNSLVIDHMHLNKAPNIQHRIYRVPGQNNPYMSFPCHSEMDLTENGKIVPKLEEVSQ